MALPTVLPDPTQTLKPVYMWAVITKANGSSQAYPCVSINEEIQVGTVKRMVPVGDYIRSDRTVPTTKDQAFVIELDEVTEDRRNWAFGSAFTQGTCTIFVTDPADASGKVKLKSNDFACSIIPGSGLQMGREAFANHSIRIETEEDAIFVVDGDA